MRRNITNKFDTVPEIAGIGYFAPKQDMQLTHLLELKEEQIRQLHDDLDQRKSSIAITPDDKKIAKLPYDLGWSKIPNEVKIVIEAIRDEMDIAFRNKKKSTDSASDDIDHNEKLKVCYYYDDY